MTTSPDGQRVSTSSRLTEICHRYGAGHHITRAVRRFESCWGRFFENFIDAVPG